MTNRIYFCLKTKSNEKKLEALRSADCQSHRQAKLLNSAQHRNKLHQFLHNIYKKIQLWLVQRKKTVGKSSPLSLAIVFYSLLIHD